MEKLYTVKSLAVLLSRSEGSIRNDLSRNPSRLPRPLAMPGRLLRWRPATVSKWLDGMERKEKVAVAPKRKRGRPSKAEQIQRNRNKEI